MLGGWIKQGRDKDKGLNKRAKPDQSQKKEKKSVNLLVWIDLRRFGEGDENGLMGHNVGRILRRKGRDGWGEEEGSWDGMGWGLGVGRERGVLKGGGGEEEGS